MNFDKLTKKELIEYIKNLDSETVSGKYGLIWDKEKEPEQIVVDCGKKIPILESIENKNITTTDSDYHLLIEGDNFHSLTVLNYTHKEKIDVIYIDPPYNTGNKDFVYNDNFVDYDDGYRHSKWLNFMEKRLKLSRDLLKEKGLIFISIGDDEFAQLKLLCDRIFNERNFITNFTWIQTNNPPSLGKIRNNMEYVLCYQKITSPIKLFGRSSNEKDSPLANAGNSLISVTIPAQTCQFPNCEDDIIIEPGEKKSGIILKTIIEVENKQNKNAFEIEFHSKWGQENIDNEIKNGTIFMIKDADYFSIRYQKGLIGYVVPDKFLDPTKFDVKDNEYGRKQLEQLVGKGMFQYPKNTPLIKTLIKMYGKDKKDITILDFFAGSGTTGQAVLELNKEDGGNRKFILCTNNENNICTDITYPRIKRAIEGYDTFKPLGGNLKYFKTDFIDNSINRDQLYYDLTEKCIPILCIKENCFEIIDSTSEYMIFSNKTKDKYTCIYFDIFGDLEKYFIEKLKNIKEEKIIYKFSLGEYIDTSEFKDLINYKVESIPHQIIEVYRKLVKMSRGTN